jgi:hypothetical protein
MHISCGVVILLILLFFGGEELLRLAFGGIFKVVAYLLLLYAAIMAAGFLLWGLMDLYDYLASLSAGGMALALLAAAAVVWITKSVLGAAWVRVRTAKVH